MPESPDDARPDTPPEPLPLPPDLGPAPVVTADTPDLHAALVSLQQCLGAVLDATSPDDRTVIEAFRLRDQAAQTEAARADRYLDALTQVAVGLRSIAAAVPRVGPALDRLGTIIDDAIRTDRTLTR